jgi:hypothetical protein
MRRRAPFWSLGNPCGDLDSARLCARVGRDCCQLIRLSLSDRMLVLVIFGLLFSRACTAFIDLCFPHFKKHDLSSFLRLT